MTTVIKPLRASNFADLDTVFSTTKTTAGCYCMWFLTSQKETDAGWGGGNKIAFEELARRQRTPMGLLAYRDGEPVGWCAVGPRSRYPRVLRSPLMRGVDTAENSSVWLVPCFYVRARHRRQGITHALLDAAIDLATQKGASAIEGFPHPVGQGRGSFLGREELFAAAGFEVIARPSPSRVLMRRPLPS